MSPATHSAWQADDAQFCWHPFTQAHTAKAPVVMVRGEAEFLWDEHGKRYFDAVSSWWVNIHGHCNPTIAQAVAEQARQLEHVMFAGIAHPPAIELAKALIDCAPAPMAKVFYSDNGSTAIEVALKMVFQYWQNLDGPNSPRKRLIALQGGYHGDTFGAMAAGQSSGFYDPFKPWLFAVDFIECGTCACTEETALAQLDALLAQQGEQTAALILEPLVQGAAGMRMMRPSFVAELCKRCHAAGVLVIFDEVFTGFGRTGTLFAAHAVAEHGGQADILCLSKGLTGGFMPMAATLASQAIYDAFLSTDVNKALLHGHSYTANPLGCAAALASLALLRSEAVQQSLRDIQTVHAEWLPRLATHPQIQNPRVCGTVAAFEIQSAQNGYGSSVSQWLRETFMERGIVVRPLGNTLYWIPPYCTSPSTLHGAYNTLMNVLDEWAAPPQKNAPTSPPGTGSELF
ncbi:MAG TPA: adenosylmethionine--8-amino-7-oxononanoate transaminase [Limnobacter sp.]|uniref:adenosylmethionine--8-amino-7-oxononanoate transaminase n=1 Tax=Limnobacter sp. TaxID=2003368 RepID=UPI002EDB5FB6